MISQSTTTQRNCNEKGTKSQHKNINHIFHFKKPTKSNHQYTSNMKHPFIWKAESQRIIQNSQIQHYSSHNSDF